MKYTTIIATAIIMTLHAPIWHHQLHILTNNILLANLIMIESFVYAWLAEKTCPQAHISKFLCSNPNFAGSTKDIHIYWKKESYLISFKLPFWIKQVLITYTAFARIQSSFFYCNVFANSVWEGCPWNPLVQQSIPVNCYIGVQIFCQSIDAIGQFTHFLILQVLVYINNQQLN